MTTDSTSAPDCLRQSLIEIAVESWRFSRLVVRMMARLDAGEANRYVSQLRYFHRKLDESLETAGLKLVNVEGHPFDAGMAASPLNLNDFAPDDNLLVEQMVEPIIMGPEGLVRTGTVMLRKIQS